MQAQDIGRPGAKLVLQAAEPVLPGSRAFIGQECVTTRVQRFALGWIEDEEARRNLVQGQKPREIDRHLLGAPDMERRDADGDSGIWVAAGAETRCRDQPVCLAAFKYCIHQSLRRMQMSGQILRLADRNDCWFRELIRGDTVQDAGMALENITPVSLGIPRIVRWRSDQDHRRWAAEPKHGRIRRQGTGSQQPDGLPGRNGAGEITELR